MNKWLGMGRLVRDPELKASGSGTEYCHFTIAVDREYTKKGEERKTLLIARDSFSDFQEFICIILIHTHSLMERR